MIEWDITNSPSPRSRRRRNRRGRSETPSPQPSSTHDNTADIGTKRLNLPSFQKFAFQLVDRDNCNNLDK